MGDTRLSGCMPCVWASCVTDTVSELMPPHAIWGEFPNSGCRGWIWKSGGKTEIEKLRGKGGMRKWLPTDDAAPLGLHGIVHRNIHKHCDLTARSHLESPRLIPICEKANSGPTYQSRQPAMVPPGIKPAVYPPSIA